MDQPPILPTIKTPADLKRLEIGELEHVAAELRAAIFDAVSKSGGHLASNLGVVELTLALHYCYDFGPHPEGPDRFILDVGHQCYPHKMLTGRQAGFDKLRKQGGVGGFPMPDESPYDLFNVGHAGTAISTAVGMARGDQAMGRKNHVVALVGDASIVNGLAFEGLNNAGTLDRQLLIVLNDNGMSISGPQGAFAEYLERVRVSTTYEEFKKVSKTLLEKMPESVSHAIEGAWQGLTDGVKGAMWGGQMFEALGLKYMGPIDGHDLPELVQFLAEIQHVDKPVLLHVKTKKGSGYEVSETDPTKLHSPAAFTVNGCRVEINKGEGKSWTAAFADAAIDLASRNEKVFALTAAMPDGTGLSKFEKAHPTRYLDTGICESHLMAMAAGMAKSGLRPLAAIYSTFTQRAFDQVWQEVALNALPVVLCMDRAGFVGSDGAVHHGFADLAFLRPMPGSVLMAPSDEADLCRMLDLAFELETFAALRYPRDNVPVRDYDAAPLELGRSRSLRTGDDATIIAYGTMCGEALITAERLAAEGIDVEVVDARFCKPLDGAMLARVLEKGSPVVTVEDHAIENGFGTAVVEHAVAAGLPVDRLRRLGHPADALIAFKGRADQLAEAGIDAAGIERTLRRMLETPSSVPTTLHPEAVAIA
jgi:1-deoxy-D-xylulose-5-phosphate synthase